MVALRSGLQPSPWRLVWHDEFAASSLSPSRWLVEDRSTFGNGNGELACLMDRTTNVALDGATLTLRARSEVPPLPCGHHDTRFPQGRAYSSAMVSTKGRAAWRYGRFEIRARLPTRPGVSEGLWPAFWLRPVGGGKGELDVLEAVGTGSDRSESGRLHQTVWYDHGGQYRKQSTTVRPAQDPSLGFHVYAAEWERGAIRWYVDGVKTFERDSSTTPWLDDAFAGPFFLRLNLAVGGSFPGPPGASTRLPGDYSIDWVRVYQR